MSITKKVVANQWFNLFQDFYVSPRDVYLLNKPLCVVLYFFFFSYLGDVYDYVYVVVIYVTELDALVHFALLTNTWENQDTKRACGSSSEPLKVSPPCSHHSYRITLI